MEEEAATESPPPGQPITGFQGSALMTLDMKSSIHPILDLFSSAARISLVSYFSSDYLRYIYIFLFNVIVETGTFSSYFSLCSQCLEQLSLKFNKCQMDK